MRRLPTCPYNLTDARRCATRCTPRAAAWTTHDPFTDPPCGTCANIGICGGKLFCMANPSVADNDPCDFLPFDLDEFLRFFAHHHPSMPDQFDLDGNG